MSQQLINLNDDLKRLQDEGYEIVVQSNHLIMKNVPYLNSQKQIRRGVLISTLTLAGNKTAIPDDHQAHFFGDVPCNEDGTPITKILNQSQRRSLGLNIVIDHSFSAKPKENGGRYIDYYQKMTTYAAILTGPPSAIDPSITAKTFSVISEENEGPFKYIDTASSRAGIGALSAKFIGKSIGIVGLGGTGSYVLDQVAKTPVNSIHIFDNDLFLQHNAFRSPGAPTLESLSLRLTKAEYFGRMYSNMHNGIVVHESQIESANIELLSQLSFVFICIDDSGAKKIIIKFLQDWDIPFVDVGMGLYQTENKLGGVIRVTASSKNKKNHIIDKQRIPLAEVDMEADEYSKNIQIADLNALNAMLAIVKWKKMVGFYLDFDDEHFSTYTIDGNAIINEDKSNES